jgi:enoyl-CoA hydratase
MGLVAGDGGAVIWPRLVGPARAKEYLLSGKLLMATEAERIGLINHAVPAEQLWEKVDEIAQSFLTMPQLAVRGTKRGLNKSLLVDMDLTLELSFALEAQTMMTSDYAEAVSAFIEKRTPRFTGR